MESSTEVNQPANTSSKPWSGLHVFTMATVCLGLGITVGYLARGSQKPVPLTPAAPVVAEQAAPAEAPAMPTMDRMKHMADKTVEPLLEQLKSKPNDPALLAQIANAYFKAHQFQEAISYAERTVQADPTHVGNRADLASYYFYSGDSDKAIATLEQALKVAPNSPQVLFNLGVLKLQAKDDRAGAIALWKQLLKANPQLPEQRKQVVKKAIAGASKKNTAAAQ